LGARIATACSASSVTSSRPPESNTNPCSPDRPPRLGHAVSGFLRQRAHQGSLIHPSVLGGWDRKSSGSSSGARHAVAPIPRDEWDPPRARSRKELGEPRLGRPVNSLVHLHCLAHGHVQGVNYRSRVAESAQRHGVVGTVANRSDGTVFIDVQGSVEAVEAFLRDVSGPRGVSHAHTVERVAEVAVSPDLVGFEILRA